MDLTEIIRRWQSGQSNRSISRATGYDRGTVGKYIELIRSIGIEKDSLLSIEQISSFQSEQPVPTKSEKTEILENYLEEFRELVSDKTNPLKPKSAFEVISERYGFSSGVSYTTFKRFARKHGISRKKSESTCRVEIPAGSQIQIDYCKVGYLLDQTLNKRRTLYAFIATLGYSRHKYVEFVYSQNQKSFVESHIRMFNYFGGLANTIRIDNLKSGVIKPDLYDPKLNRTYMEMAQYYEIFIDACRVGTPKDKPIVERDVQTIREEFRKMFIKNPSLKISQANKEIINWLINTYGQREHGTTHQKPYECFINQEKPLLKPLPAVAYETAEWKEATVHPDHFIQVNSKSYSVPHAYIGKKVWAKVTRKIVYVFYNEQLVKQHIIPQGYRQTDLNDFPDDMRYAIDKDMPYYLRKKAARITSELGELITKILSPHAYINMRKAQSILSISEKYPVEIIAQASRIALEDFSSVHPKLFKSIIEKIEQQSKNQTQIEISEETRNLIRNMEYFSSTN